MNDLTKSQGFTLIELLIYIFIAGLVALFASKAWFDSAVFSMGSEKKVKLSAKMENLNYTLERDFELLGLSNMQDEGGVSSNDGVFIDAVNSDFSSFDFYNHGTTDSIEYVIGKFDANNDPDGFEKIRLKLDNDTLTRVTMPFAEDGTAGDTSSVVLADAVDEFDIELGYYQPKSESGDSLVFDFTYDNSRTGADYLVEYQTNSTSSAGDGTEFFGATFSAENVMTGLQFENGYGNVQTFTLTPGHTYSLRFQVQYNSDFVNSYNIATDTVKIELKTASDTSALVTGVDPFVLMPAGAGNPFPMTYDFSVAGASGSADVDLMMQLKVRLGNVENSPELWVSDVEIEDYHKSSVDYMSDLTGTDENKIAQKMSVTSLKVTLKLTEDVGSDISEYKTTRYYPLPNHGVMQ